MLRINLSKVSLLTLLAFVGSAKLQAQQIDPLLNLLDSKYPQEKIHLHLDKSYYNPGETIWFKAYISNSNLSAPLSTTMYADLIDDKGNTLQSRTMPILEGGAASAFELTDSVYPSQMYIRAYTAWMLNFDSSLLCIKAIPIIPAKKAIKKQPVADTYTLTLFPEGGDLVEDLQSQIAFKATDQTGKPIIVTGTITDAKGNSIATLNTLHDGMGRFSITPLANETYKVVWKDVKAATHTTPFPIIKKQGLVLTVANTGGKVFYNLERSVNADEGLRSLSVVAQMHQQMVYNAKINMATKTIVSAPINTDGLPPGVMQITVFNALQQPIAERVVFLYGSNDLSFITDLHLVEKNIVKRGRNTLQIDVGGTLKSNLSIAVTDAGLDPGTANEENIMSDLLLTSDLKGHIYNPAYYFLNDADSIKQQLDLVMMTNGWRRFKWEDVLASRFPSIKYLPENLLSIKGAVFGLTKNQLKDKELIASIKTRTSSGNFFTIPINENGQFNLNGMYFFDTTKLYYQINNDKDKKLTETASFSFDHNFIRSPGISKELLQTVMPAIQPDSAIIVKSNVLAALRRSQFEKEKVKTLTVVKIVAKQKTAQEKMDDELTSGLFKGGDNRTFVLTDDPTVNSAQTILSYLQGKVAGLQISTVGDGSVSWRGSPTSLFLNESDVDVQMLQSISLGDVAMIKIFDPPFFGAPGGGAGGAIAVYYKKGNNGSNDKANGLNVATLYGYSPIKEFYSPNYGTDDDLSVTDTRSTLYWAPFILLDAKKRRVKIPFYNSDDCKWIRVVIEGINEEGQYTREEKVFE